MYWLKKMGIEVIYLGDRDAAGTNAIGNTAVRIATRPDTFREPFRPTLMAEVPRRKGEIFQSINGWILAPAKGDPIPLDVMEVPEGMVPVHLKMLPDLTEKAKYMMTVPTTAHKALSAMAEIQNCVTVSTEGGQRISANTAEYSLTLTVQSDQSPEEEATGTYPPDVMAHALEMMNYIGIANADILHTDTCLILQGHDSWHHAVQVFVAERLDV